MTNRPTLPAVFAAHASAGIGRRCCDIARAGLRAGLDSDCQSSLQPGRATAGR